ncbi:hypothetical protein [Microcoleus sp. F4-D5]|uniref:hypothetical protein n=1 Tax=Microcoleus sp. F4-D5 TaxID=2818760 RepID=UPI002FD5EC80
MGDRVFCGWAIGFFVYRAIEFERNVRWGFIVEWGDRIFWVYGLIGRSTFRETGDRKPQKQSKMRIK